MSLSIGRKKQWKINSKSSNSKLFLKFSINLSISFIFVFTLIRRLKSIFLVFSFRQWNSFRFLFYLQYRARQFDLRLIQANATSFLSSKWILISISRQSRYCTHFCRISNIFISFYIKRFLLSLRFGVFLMKSFFFSSF